jgi:PAS domain S-box-containing protein
MNSTRAGKNKKSEILIAEDSPTQAEQLKHFLKENNFNVTVAENGKQALTILEKFIPDLVISDIIMPEMNGYELCSIIKADERLMDIPVILLTTLTDPEDVLNGLTCGADNFFTKPYQEDYLISQIHQIIFQPKMQKNENIRIMVEIFFAGKKRLITANQMQMLTLLLSTYESAVIQNRQLLRTQEELKQLNNTLEDKVEKRTAALNETMEKYLDLYNNSPSMFYSFETASKSIIECNDTLINLTGYKRSDIIGENVFSLYQPDNPEEVNRFWETFVKTGDIKNFELELMSRLGGKIPVLLNVAAVRGTDGEVISGRVVMQDISMLVQAREQTQQSEERFRSVSDSAVDSIITIDEVGIIVGWNKGAQKTFGYDEMDIIGQQVTILMPDYYATGHNDALKRIQQGGKHHVIGNTVELSGKRKNGEVFPIELSLAQWNTSSDSFFTGIIRDITSRKLVEKELIASKEKAEESDKLKSAFLANMSHEIRTPLNGILGFSELLKEPELGEKEKEDFIKTINQCSHQLLHIVTDVMDISKIESGVDKAHPVVFNLQELVRETQLFFQPLADQKNLNLTFNNNLPSELVQIFSDPVKLRNALNNIIENAIKFTDTGGIEINISANNNYLIFKISDSGIGIEPVYQKVIFDRFRQVEISMQRKYGGTGLGLSLAKSFAEMLGGTVEVDSSLGKGSTFTISISLVRPEKLTSDRKNNEPGISAELEWSNKTILLAEDEASNSNLIKMMLKPSRVNILLAENGSQAVELCKNEKDISMVIMDIKMPVMDGLAATRLIKSFRNHLPVIATTAYADISDKAKCFEAGCNDYLSKPFKKDELINMISKYLI